MTPPASGVLKVHELARELGVRVSVVLDAARANDLRYLRTASSPVPASDADAIRAYVRRAVTARAADRASTASTASTTAPPGDGFAPNSELARAAAALGFESAPGRKVDPDVAATAAALGVEFTDGGATYRSPERQRDRRHRPAAARMHPVSSEPTGMAAEIRAQWSSVTPAQAERIAASYEAKGITAEMAHPYWDGGLGPYDFDAVHQCIHSGLHPSDLALLIEGRSVVNRLRGGERVEVLLTQLPSTGAEAG